MNQFEMIQHNYQEIQEKIAVAAKKGGRDLSEITLLAVTKKKSLETIQTLMDLGVTCFGENYPDETLAKKEIFLTADPKVQLVMIGHLQSRKTAIIADLFDQYHSLDRLKTAARLNDLLQRSGRTMPIMVEINTGDEDSKHGWRLQKDRIDPEFLKDFEQILGLEQLKPIGLMSLPPFFDDPEKTRPYFAALREIRDGLQTRFGILLPHLSMGTSVDFAAAIEEGATYVRIGTSLTGLR